ncbi:MAG: hypothetical protein WAQ28_00825 [Bacteroidia bacterium]|jgi:hypothetical protein
MMDNSNIITLFGEKFHFLHGLNYTDKQIFEDQSYAVGIVLKNPVNGLIFSFAYYKANKVSHTNSARILLKLSNNNNHIDFSRLFKKDGFFIKNCQYQYIMLNELDLNTLLSKIVDIIKEKYIKLFMGLEWIEINYDFRDDY